MKNFINIKKILGTDIPKDYQHDFYKEILRINNWRCQIVLITLSILSIPDIILWSSKPSTVYYLSILVFVLEIIGLVSLFLFKNKRYVGTIHISIIVICLAWSQIVNFFGYKYKGDIVPYIIGLLGLCAFAYLKPKHSLILFGIQHLSFLILNAILINDNSFLLDVSANATVAAIFACIVAMLNYRSKLNSYLNKKLIDELNLANAKLKEYVHIDAGTGIKNRLAFDQKLEAEWASAKRSKEFISLIILDVDFFKQYNDTYGHSKGDICLRDVAQCISRNTIQSTDFAARFGGEEFVVLLPHTDKDAAVFAAEKIKKEIEMLNIPHEGRQDGILFVTLSLGVSCIVPDDIETSSIQLIEHADNALYAAKKSGRNKVMSY